MRLDAYLARAGLASRKEARGLIRRGAVHVDGEECRDSQRRITTEKVSLGDSVVDSPAEQTDFLVHKPVGLACSHDDRESPLVFDLLDETLRRRGLKIAGRLDRATSGLLVLTTDGDFIHRLTHPARKVPKRYRIRYEGTLVDDAVARCLNGIPLGAEGRLTRPAELVLEADGRATMVVREGRTHQVRRMIHKLGGEVVGLHRDRFGDLDLPPNLPPGALRPLEPGERACLLIESSL
jgi:16S rRNA pseudouridine516 synthase